MVTSDFRPEVEVEIRTFRACAMKSMQYSPYLWPNRRNFRILKEIGVEEHDGDPQKKERQILDRKWKYGRFAHAQ